MLSSYEYSYSYEYVQLNATFQLTMTASAEFIIRRRAHTPSGCQLSCWLGEFETTVRLCAFRTAVHVR